jgi:curved DNA-binding protein CbpA
MMCQGKSASSHESSHGRKNDFHTAIISPNRVGVNGRTTQAETTGLQIALNPAGTMTLYDEAGVSRRATAEEIRQAYHNFVRLLHPDTVRDPALQTVAEAQLRRVNAVFEILNDPKKRADYDLTLQAGPPTGLPVASRPIPVNRQAMPSLWGITLVAGITVLFWAGGKPSTQAASTMTATELQNETLPVSIETEPSAAIPVETAGELRQLRKELREVRKRQEITSPPEGAWENEPEGDDGAEGFAANSASGDRAVSPPAPLATLAAPASVLASSTLKPGGTQGSLYGTWLYAQRADSTPKKDWYPPDFIELKIQPAATGIAGRFQARYRVGDRPISPEVRFRFEGKGDPLVWVGANGAQGEIRVKQTSPLTVQVDWITTRAGEIPSLTSGSSLLVKSPE